MIFGIYKKHAYIALTIRTKRMLCTHLSLESEIIFCYWCAGPVSDEETQQGLEDSEEHKKKHDPILNKYIGP